MRKLCFLFLFSFLFHFAYAQSIPEPQGWVSDFAGVISPEYKEKLTALIEELEQKTSSEIAVVTVTSISPYEEIEYARLLFDNWKPGKKGKDNGVLVLLAIKERRWRIETGYGVEGILPDAKCGEIGRNYMVPYFKEGKYSEGLYQGVSALAAAIVKDAKIHLESLGDFEESKALPKLSDNTVFLLFLGIFIFLILFNYLFNRRTAGYGDNTGINSRNSWGSGWGGGSWGGGGFGGGGGGFGGGGGGGGGAGGGF